MNHLKNFTYFTYNFEFQSVRKLTEFLINPVVYKSYKACLIDIEEFIFNEAKNYVCDSGIEFRIMEIKQSSKLSSALELLVYLNGIGNVICGTMKDIRPQIVQFLITYPKGTIRKKSVENLRSLSEAFYQQRLETMKNEEKTQKAFHRRRRVSPSTVFKNFLINKFGIECLNQGTGILDVAGGKGELTFKLNRHGVKSTIVDPRQPKRSVLRYLTKDQILRKTSTQNRTFNFDMPAHLQTWFIGKSDNDESYIRLLLEKESDNVYVNDKLKSNLHDHADLKEQLMSCSMIVGLHPDQATELILDYCLANNKSFAIVPCCVFHKSKLALHRKDIKSYENFCTYLLKKDKRIKTTDLGFLGRNKCLYLTL